MRYRKTNVGVLRRARALTPATRRPIGYARRLFRRRESVSCRCQRPNQSLVPPCRTSTSASHLPVALDVGHAFRRRNEGTARMVPRNDRGAGLVPGDMSQDWDRRCTRARLRVLSFAVMIAVLVGCATGQPAAKPSASCAGPPATYVADVRPPPRTALLRLPRERRCCRRGPRLLPRRNAEGPASVSDRRGGGARNASEGTIPAHGLRGAAPPAMGSVRRRRTMSRALSPRTVCP
jgi:hypothetical protein